jgi:hypothetical protein
MRQGELFPSVRSTAPLPDWRPGEAALQDWRERVAAFQHNRRRGQAADQACLPLFGPPGPPTGPGEVPDPLLLAPLALQFWRWPVPAHSGPALYFVLDHGLGDDRPLLLYVGETAHADRRWKGDHDCKAYLADYGETLSRGSAPARLSIRFWCDAPPEVRRRRQLEQQQIGHWQPPFNKECRERWQTPFQKPLD